MKNLLFRNFFSAAWGPRREIPRLQSKTFNKLWKDRQEKARKTGNDDGSAT
jgi:hypothetical protein